jgi:peptidoglycan/xylan/chitin deacetylase (PgdA/CDA1 family)
MYHDVVAPGADDASGFEGRDAALYKLSTSDFDEHLRQIGRAIGSRPVSRVPDVLATGERAPLFLTFDDGGESAATVVADKLDAFGWSGHFFVTSDRIDSPGFLSAEQIRELVRRGHVVGSHSSSHPRRISSCSRAQIDHEWSNSVRVLSDIVGAEVNVASIPGGFGSREVVESAAAAGIRAIFTSEPIDEAAYVDGCLVLGRYAIQRHTPAEVAAALASWKLAPRLRQRLLWSVKKAAKAIGGERYIRIRKRILG